jgi:anti-sigma28 factor (negative regulator of flagellin synthesis)
MITDNGYIETLNEQEAIEWGKYEVITEEITENIIDNG